MSSFEPQVPSSLRAVGVRELRADLAAHVRRAQAGQRTIVSINGVDVAQLGPLDSTGQPTLADLIASGQLIAPRRTTPGRPLEPVHVWTGTRLDRALRDVRG